MFSETRGEWNKFVKNYKSNQFAIHESASALRGFVKQFRIDSIKGFGQREVLQRAKPDVLRLNCETVRKKVKTFGLARQGQIHR